MEEIQLEIQQWDLKRESKSYVAWFPLKTRVFIGREGNGTEQERKCEKKPGYNYGSGQIMGEKPGHGYGTRSTGSEISAVGKSVRVMQKKMGPECGTGSVRWEISVRINGLWV